MKNFLLSLLFLSLSCLNLNAIQYSDTGKTILETYNFKPSMSFIENKGQVSNQYNQPSADVRFSSRTKDMVIHLKDHGLSYQLYKFDYKSPIVGSNFKVEDNLPEIKTTIYRIDADWLGTNENISYLTSNSSTGYDHYYLTNCADKSLFVKSYFEIFYNNIYQNTRLHYYFKDNTLKYDFIISPGGDYKDIKLSISGAEKIVIESDGSVNIHTPLGIINEAAPVVYQNNNQNIIARWVLNGNILSFEITGLNLDQETIIDPGVRVWGTYYGGSSDEYTLGICTDSSGNIYLPGSTNSSGGTTIATTGSHQTVIGGNYDAFLVKFNNSGIRQWSTYYGGSDNDRGNSCVTDNKGYIYLSGTTASSNGTVIATSGSHQPALGGSDDAFLVKFNNNGIRQWGTYYGGTSNEYAFGCTTDTACNVYIVGGTSSSTAIASSGSHQSSNSGNQDAYLAKFNSTGVRQWGTYFGGTSTETGIYSITDNNCNIYITGQVHSTNSNGISTSGGHQKSAGGNWDAYLAKFNSNGVQQWGTYYGDTGYESARFLAFDTSGYVYLSGRTSGKNTGVISTSNGYQISHGGNWWDSYLVKFNSNGVRQWGTYYGDTGNDLGQSCVVDKNGYVYLSGETNSTSKIATSKSFQDSFSGGTADAFLAIFNSDGVRQIATYFGGSGNDIYGTCAVDNSGNIFLTGTTTSTDRIATSGSHQDTLAGNRDLFLVKFSKPSFMPINLTPVDSQTICYNTSTTLHVKGTGTIKWYNSQTTSTVLSVGNTFKTPILTYSKTFFVEDSNSSGISERLPIKVTVLNKINPPLNTTPPINLSICYNSSSKLYVSSSLITGWYTDSVGGNFLANGKIYSTPKLTSTTTFYVQDSSHCGKSKRTPITVVVMPQISFKNNVSICKGNTFVVGNNSYNTAGIFFDTLKAANGCDSFIETEISILPTYNDTQTIVICHGKSIKISENIIHNKTGIYTDILVSSDGCDSTVVTDLTILPAKTRTSNITICYGTSIQIGDSVYTKSGNYSNIFTAYDGCDSIIYTNLTILQQTETFQNLDLCYGEMITIGMHSYNKNGNYLDTLKTHLGCDSIIHTSINVHSKIDTSISVSGNTISANLSGAKYQWVNCTAGYSHISGETNQSFTPLQNGFYAVFITVDSCSDTSSCTSVITNNTQQINLDHAVKVYPNPNMGIFNILVPEKSYINITDVFGRSIYSDFTVSKDQLIDIQNESAGIYILTIITKNSRTVKQVFISK